MGLTAVAAILTKRVGFRLGGCEKKKGRIVAKGARFDGLELSSLKMELQDCPEWMT